MATALQINQQSLISFIVHDLLINRFNAEPITAETNLITSGVIDSLTLIQLVTYLEKETKIEIKDEDVNPDNFQDVNSIIKYLERRLVNE